jgi:hypothetical protein
MPMRGGLNMSHRRLLAASGGALPWYRAGGAPLPVAAYQPKGATNLAASYVNLANPGTYDAIPGVAPTWTSGTGWGFNGSTQFLETGVTPDSNQAWSMVILSGNGSPARDVSTVVSLSGTSFFGFANSAAKNISFLNGGALAGPINNGGVFAFSGNKGYANGIATIGTIPLGSGDALPSFVIGARRTGGTQNRFWDSSVGAVVIYSSVLTDSQVAAVSAAMAAL